METQNRQSDLDTLLAVLKVHCSQELARGSLLAMLGIDKSPPGSSMTLWAGCSGFVITFEFNHARLQVRWLDQQVTTHRDILQKSLRNLCAGKVNSKESESLCA